MNAVSQWSTRVDEQLEIMNARLCSRWAADRLRTQVLTPDEREQLRSRILEWRDLTAVHMWMELRNTSHARAVIEVAKLLDGVDETTYRWLLREVGEMPEDPDDIEFWAQQAGGLVINASTREVYWEGQPVECDWYRFNDLWAYFLKLAVQSKEGESLGAEMLVPDARPQLLYDRKNRLKSTPGFPLSLMMRVGKGGPGRQRFDIPPKDIHILKYRADSH